jgi:nucleoside-diphosphate-sugar epimerase
VPQNARDQSDRAAGVVALTGATGFIGQHLTEHLAADGWRIRALSRRRSTGQPRAGVTIISGTLEDTDSLNRLVDGADVVVHGAGAIKAADSATFHRVNAEGTDRLAKACADQPGQPRLIYVSSLAARSPELSAYAASKRAGEVAVAAHGDRLNWTVLRPSAVYGPGDKATLSLFRCMKFGVVPAPNLNNARLSLIYVDDFCAAVARLLAAPPASGATFEIGDAREAGYSWREIAEAAAPHLKRRPICVALPKPLILLAAMINAALAKGSGAPRMLLPGKVNEIYHPDWVCRENLLAELIDWQPKIMIDEGFKRTFDWYRSNRWL